LHGVARPSANGPVFFAPTTLSEAGLFDERTTSSLSRVHSLERCDHYPRDSATNHVSYHSRRPGLPLPSEQPRKNTESLRFHASRIIHWTSKRVEVFAEARTGARLRFPMAMRTANPHHPTHTWRPSSLCSASEDTDPRRARVAHKATASSRSHTVKPSGGRWLSPSHSPSCLAAPT